MPEFADYATLIPYPAEDAFKYSRGKAVVLAGSAPYPGAACLCAHAAQLSGAGYTQVFTNKANRALVQQYRPSLVVDQFSAFDVASAIDSKYPGAFIVGPGFDTSDTEAESQLKRILKLATAPVLVDGGALSFLSVPKARKLLLRRSELGLPTVLTPHMGEASKLGAPYGMKPKAGQAESARSLALCYGSTVVLKGHDTVISNGEYEVVITHGTPALSKAGTGDVLAGLIGGFMAQGMDAFDAARLGVYVHAEAGIVATEQMGIVSVCAEDVLASVPQTLMRIGASRN